MQEWGRISGFVSKAKHKAHTQYELQSPRKTGVNHRIIQSHRLFQKSAVLLVSDTNHNFSSASSNLTVKYGEKCVWDLNENLSFFGINCKICSR